MFCAGCHGMDGSGMAMLGAPPLTENAWTYGGSLAAIMNTIEHGRVGEMPGFEEVLNEYEITVLSAYIYSLEVLAEGDPVTSSAPEFSLRDAGRTSLMATDGEKRKAAEVEMQRRNAKLHAYIAEVQTMVERRWSKPEGTQAPDEAVVLVHINPDTGRILSFDVQRCSGSTAFCESVRQTMDQLQSLPLPPDAAAVRGGIRIRFTPEVGSTSAAQEGRVDERYFQTVREWLDRHKDYPILAQREGKEGSVVLAFTLNRQGTVLEHTIVRSSGHTVLDNAVEHLIRRVQPLPAIPPEMNAELLQVIVPIEFRLDRAANERALPIVTDISPGSAGPFVVGQPYGAETLPEGYQILRQDENIFFEGDEYLETRLSLRHQDRDELIATAFEDNGQLVVAEIRVLNEGFSTSEGFRVGTSLYEILRRYPQSEVGYSYLMDDFVLVDTGHPGLQDVLFMVDLDDFNGDLGLLDCYSDFCPLPVYSFRPDTLIREIRVH